MYIFCKNIFIQHTAKWEHWKNRINWIELKPSNLWLFRFFPQSFPLELFWNFRFSTPLNKDELWKSSWGRTSAFSRGFQDFCCWSSWCYWETQWNCVRCRAPVTSTQTSTSGVSASPAIPARPLRDDLVLRHCSSSLFLSSVMSLQWLKNVHLSTIKYEVWRSLGLWNLFLSSFILSDFYVHL